jgi:PAS domain S-box-containing protein
LLNEKGNPIGAVWLGTDITQRKRLEESLKESEERYRALFENSIEGVFTVDLGGHFASINRAIEELLGYSKEELIGMSYKRLLPAEDVESVFEEYNRLFRTGEPIRDLVYEIVRKDGERRLIEGYVNVINREGTIVGFQGTLRDITEGKKAQDALRSERDKLAALMDGLARTEIGIDIVGVDYRILFQNRTLKERFGDLTAEFCYEKYMGRQEPCDLCPMVKAIESNNVESVELTGTDGRDYQLFSAPLPNPDGTVDKVIETVVDITERRKADKAVKASEEQYRALVENANEAIIVAQDGMLRFTNPKAAEFTGYSEEELTSKAFLEFIHPDDRDMVLERHLRRLKGDELPYMYPFRIVDKEGDIKWVEINAVLIEWEGRPATLDFLSDITDRKQAEEQLERSFVDLAETVSRAIGSRDPYTAAHQRRVAELVRLVGEKMGLDKNRLQGLYIGGLLHDIGKISAPETILTKSGKLADEEWNLIRLHTKRGYEILNDTSLPWPVADMALHHHERLDGSGYPDGIGGDKLSLDVRILGVCDVVEAMSSHRPYRPARTRKELWEELNNGRGTKYDTDVVDIALGIIESGELDSLLRRSERCNNER